LYPGSSFLSQFEPWSQAAAICCPLLRQVRFHRSGEGRGELAPAAQYPSSAQQTRRLGFAGLKPVCRRHARPLQMETRKRRFSGRPPHWIAPSAFR
jgi:hypothetical protein